ncbi:MAG: NADH-quinone oxidoreductase subunit J [Anaerolineales bacterium]|jgi:NADH-quinone oxidoreductase subunit J
MTAELIVFFILALVAVGAALGMLFSKNAIYAAIFLVLNFATVAVFFLTLGGAFIAITQVAVYAGAIMVLFLFVIMLLGADQLGQSETLGWQRPVALLLGLVLLVETGYVLFTQAGQIDVAAALPDGFGSPFEVGKLLFNQYLLPFEVTSVLLLVAMIGAIVLTRQEKKK